VLEDAADVSALDVSTVEEPTLVLGSALQDPCPSSVLDEREMGRVPAKVVSLVTSDADELSDVGGRVAQGVLVLLVEDSVSVSELAPLVDEAAEEEPMGRVPLAMMSEVLPVAEDRV
jgi:hypothetical protein